MSCVGFKGLGGPVKISSVQICLCHTSVNINWLYLNTLLRTKEKGVLQFNFICDLESHKKNTFEILQHVHCSGQQNYFIVKKKKKTVKSRILSKFSVETLSFILCWTVYSIVTRPTLHFVVIVPWHLSACLQSTISGICLAPYFLTNASGCRILFFACGSYSSSLSSLSSTLSTLSLGSSSAARLPDAV